MEKAIRQSNFELLRILCMFGVLCNHTLQSVYPDLNTPVNYPTHHFQVLLMSMAIISVNCFVLISGYFRIKQSWRGISNLYTQCAFYALVCSLVGLAMHEISTIEAIKRTVFALSESGMWFIVAYFGLYLIAPILNKGYANLDESQKSPLLILMLILDVYLGYLHQNEEVTVSGYHVIHFIVLYYMGCYLSERPIKAFTPFMGGGKWLILCFLCVLLHAVKVRFEPMAVLFSFRYNSPMVMIVTLTFFHWVMTWRIQKKWINWISASVLSVYIIQSQPVGCSLLYGTLSRIHEQYATMPAAFMMVSVVVCFFAACILLDKVRLKICSPINGFIAKYMKSKSSLLYGKRNLD